MLIQRHESSFLSFFNHLQSLSLDDLLLGNIVCRVIHNSNFVFYIWKIVRLSWNSFLVLSNRASFKASSIELPNSCIFRFTCWSKTVINLKYDANLFQNDIVIAISCFSYPSTFLLFRNLFHILSISINVKTCVVLVSRPFPKEELGTVMHSRHACEWAEILSSSLSSSLA